MSLSSPVFIVGCSRSGTTLLRLMLTQSATLHIPAESEFLLTLCDRQDDYGDFAQAHQRWYFIRDLQTTEVSMGASSFPIFGLTEEEAEQTLASTAPTDFAGASAALFSAAARKQGKSRWGDKTPHYVRHIEWIATAFPDAKFVHMIRDGRDVARSRVQAGFSPTLRHSARHWKREVNLGRTAGLPLGPDRYFELFYEKLVREPESTLRTLCDWLELPFEAAMLSFHQEEDPYIPEEHAHLHQRIDQPIDPSRAQAWKRMLSRREVAEIEDVAGSLLRELGYELTGARPPRWKQALRTLYRATRPYVQPLFKKLKRLGLE